MGSVHFPNAFERWYALHEAERKRLEDDKKRGPILSWEALDHLCGLAVESGLKALMFKAGLVQPDRDGDYPKADDGRRPHVDELWNLFMAMATGRMADAWVRTLAGGRGTPINAFQAWRCEHRYAPDGTVTESVMQLRLTMAKRLKTIAQEEGL